MNRILDFTPASEEAVVSRILVQVHQAVDVHFPAAREATRKFTKTVFSEESEPTEVTKDVSSVVRDYADRPIGTFADDEPTSPGREIQRESATPIEIRLPPPPSIPSAPSELTGSPKGPQPPPSLPPVPRRVASSQTATPPPSKQSAQSQMGASQMTMGDFLARHTSDWTIRITLILLVTGALVLGYVLFA